MFLKEISVFGHEEEDEDLKEVGAGELQERASHAQARTRGGVSGHVSGYRSAHSEHRYFLFPALTILSKTLSIKDCWVVFFSLRTKK